MFPTSYACTCCGERFRLAQRAAYYCFDFDGGPIDGPLPLARIFPVPVRPAWCKDCAEVCLVEDIAPVRAFENAFGAVRAGRAVEYPLETDQRDPEEAREDVAAYLRWRLTRRHPARALCCGRTNFQFLDVAQPLLKHAECDFGVIEPRYTIGSFNGSAPGTRSPANFPVHDGEGVLFGLLTWLHRDSGTWDFVPAAYPPFSED